MAAYFTSRKPTAAEKRRFAPPNNIVVVLESQNPIAKQIFFGWGSDQSNADMSFYGTEVLGTWGPGHENRWRWALSEEGVNLMIDHIVRHINDRNYYEKHEVKAARELLDRLAKSQESCTVHEDCRNNLDLAAACVAGRRAAPGKHR